MASLFDLLNSVNDIDNLVASGQRESETLEYKDASTTLKSSDHNELGKDASALANTLGGLIVYGVETDKKDATKPVRRVPIDPKNIAIIQQVIASAVRPPLEGMRVKAIPQLGVPECFLVDVPVSPIRPHQAVQLHKYFRRNGPQSEPMTHDLIELHFGRRLGPIVRPTLAFTRPQVTVKGGVLGDFNLSVRVQNHGGRPAKYMLVIAKFPAHALAQLTRTPALGFTESVGDMVQLHQTLGPTVLHPGLDMAVSDIDFKLNRAAIQDGSAVIRVVAHADHMAPQETAVRVVELPGTTVGYEIEPLR